MITEVISIDDLPEYKVEKSCVRIISEFRLSKLDLDEQDFCALDSCIRRELQGNKQLPDWFFRLLPVVEVGTVDYSQDCELAAYLRVELEQLYLSVINMAETDFVEITKAGNREYDMFLRTSLNKELSAKLLQAIHREKKIFVSNTMERYMKAVARLRFHMLESVLLDRGKLFRSIDKYRDYIITDTLTFACSSETVDEVKRTQYYGKETVHQYCTTIANFGFGCIEAPSAYWNYTGPTKLLDSLPGETDAEKQRLFCRKHNIHCATLDEAVSVPCPVAKTQTVYNFKVGKEKQHD